MAGNKKSGSDQGATTSAATIASVAGGLGRMADANDPVARERMRRLFERRRMQNGGRLSTILSDELRNRVT
jgi:hypothetical protein